MKKKINYYINENLYEKEINYIPFRYISAIIITILELVLILAIIILLIIFVKPFIILVVISDIYALFSLIASNDNPEYKIPWIFIIMSLPVIGFMLYFIFYKRELSTRFKRKLKN